MKTVRSLLENLRTLTEGDEELRDLERRFKATKGKDDERRLAIALVRAGHADEFCDLPSSQHALDTLADKMAREVDRALEHQRSQERSSDARAYAWIDKLRPSPAWGTPQPRAVRIFTSVVLHVRFLPREERGPIFQTYGLVGEQAAQKFGKWSLERPEGGARYPKTEFAVESHPGVPSTARLQDTLHFNFDHPLDEALVSAILTA